VGSIERRLDELERFYGNGRPRHPEELENSFSRAQFEYLEQVASIRAPGFRRAKNPEDRNLPPEAEQLWGPDKNQWRIHETAMERALSKERERGVSEDILADVEEALHLWREQLAGDGD